MLVVIVDDNELHADLLEHNIRTYCKAKSLQMPEIKVYLNGKDFLDNIGIERPDLVSLDLNMPVMDGLTALVKGRMRYPKVPFMIVSSENVNKIGKHATRDLSGVPEDDKEVLLEKVVKRVEDGAEKPGKINSVLEAVAQLHMDPILVSKKLGALAYLQKPFTTQQIQERLSRFIK